MSGVDEYFTSGGVLGGAFDAGAWVPDYQRVNYDCIAMAFIVIVIIWVLYKVYYWVTSGSSESFDSAGAAWPVLTHTGSKDNFSGGQEAAPVIPIMDHLGAGEGMEVGSSSTQRKLAWESMEDNELDPTLFGDTSDITTCGSGGKTPKIGAKGISSAVNSSRCGVHTTPGTEGRSTAHKPVVSSFTGGYDAETDFELAMNGSSVN